MESRQKIDPEICEQDGDKTDYGKISNAFAVPSTHQPGMQKGGIDEPGNQRPGLFGIPAPVTAPGGIGPDGSGNDPCRQKQETE